MNGSILMYLSDIVVEFKELAFVSSFVYAQARVEETCHSCGARAAQRAGEGKPSLLDDRKVLRIYLLCAKAHGETLKIVF